MEIDKTIADKINKMVQNFIQKQHLHDFAAIMNTKEGRRWYSMIMAACHDNKSTFSTDPAIMAYNEGMRGVALMLKGFISRLGQDGLNLKHKSEQEWLDMQYDLRNQAEEKLKKEHGYD